MLPIIGLLLQAGPSAPAPAPTPASAPPTTINLRPFAPPACKPSDDPGDVVVCARRDANAAFRLGPLAPQTVGPLLPPAQARVGPGTVAVETESATMAGGAISKRAMVRFKLPF